MKASEISPRGRALWGFPAPQIVGPYLAEEWDGDDGAHEGVGDPALLIHHHRTGGHQPGHLHWHGHTCTGAEVPVRSRGSRDNLASPVSSLSSASVGQNVVTTMYPKNLIFKSSMNYVPIVANSPS